MVRSIEFFQLLDAAYAQCRKPLCRELELPQTALDILLFLANNPEYKTARDIVEVRHLKANLVSVNVTRLVDEGYLRRLAAAGDRRKTLLELTEKAEPIVARGREFQKEFYEKLFLGVSQGDREALSRILGNLEQNLEKIAREDG